MSNRVLFVESDPALSSLCLEALESRGFAVESLTDAARCLETVRAERPDAIVLSVELAAGQNGYLVCGKLKKDDALKDIPVVIRPVGADRPHGARGWRVDDLPGAHPRGSASTPPRLQRPALNAVATCLAACWTTGTAWLQSGRNIDAPMHGR